MTGWEDRKRRERERAHEKRRERKREKERERERDRHRHTDRERETDRQTNRFDMTVVTKAKMQVQGKSLQHTVRRCPRGGAGGEREGEKGKKGGGVRKNVERLEVKMMFVD